MHTPPEPPSLLVSEQPAAGTQEPAAQPELLNPVLSALPAHARSPHPVANPFFFGRFGLRAGYGMAILIAIYLVLQIVAGIAAVIATGKVQEAMAVRADVSAHPHATHSFSLPFSPALVISSDAVIFLGLLLTCWLFSRAERRPLRAYGIGRYRVADIVPGAFWGLAVMSALVASLHALHLLVFDGRVLFGAPVFLYGAKWLLAFLLVGFAEEYAFRGYLQYALMRGVWGLAERVPPTAARAVAFWISACTLSLVFAWVHARNGGETFFGLVQVFFAGITFAYALWRTGSLWWSIGFHMTWDWAQSFLFGVADSGNISVGRLFVTHPQGRTLLSGGADGPEGSIFATIALLLTIAIIRFTTRPGVQPALEQQPRPEQKTPPPLLHNSVA